MEERKRLVLTLEELIGAVAVRNAITQYQVRRAATNRFGESRRYSGTRRRKEHGRIPL
jgi:hypothetical protein